MSKLIAKLKIVGGRLQLVRIGEGEQKLRPGCAYKMYAALRRVQSK